MLPMKVCSYCGRENDETLTHCSECGTDLADAKSSPASAPAPVQPKPKVVCPACGAHDNYENCIALRGSFSWVMFFLGGFIAVLFHNASRERRVQCNACSAIFGVRTRLSKLSLVILWLLILPTIVAILLKLLSALFSW